MFDFFDGKTTLIQGKLIEQWLLHSENEEKFYGCLDEWERIHPQFSPNQDKAQRDFQRLLDGETLPTRQLEALSGSERRLFGRRTAWVAAITVAASALFILSYAFRADLLHKTYSSKSAETCSFQLTDGTDVTLNANSTLTVPRFGFGSDVREVTLEGEAEFKVTHKVDNLRFRVLMGGGYRIEVLGTKFTAFSRKRGKRVFLSSGKVKLELPEGKQLFMKPGNYFSSDVKGGMEITSPREPLIATAWKDHTFYFDNTPVSEVAEQIHERFDVKINIADSLLANRKIGGTYQARQVDELLDILSQLLEIEITQKTDYIELRTSKFKNL